eukprot:9741912-Ditylum_brightwellii.AAC.1
MRSSGICHHHASPVDEKPVMPWRLASDQQAMSAALKTTSLIENPLATDQMKPFQRMRLSMTWDERGQLNLQRRILA